MTNRNINCKNKNCKKFKSVTYVKQLSHHFYERIKDNLCKIESMKICIRHVWLLNTNFFYMSVQKPSQKKSRKQVWNLNYVMTNMIIEWNLNQTEQHSNLKLNVGFSITSLEAFDRSFIISPPNVLIIFFRQSILSRSVWGWSSIISNSI
jgi:hypothetical protein